MWQYLFGSICDQWTCSCPSVAPWLHSNLNWAQSKQLSTEWLSFEVQLNCTRVQACMPHMPVDICWRWNWFEVNLSLTQRCSTTLESNRGKLRLWIKQAISIIDYFFKVILIVFNVTARNQIWLLWLIFW
jgi:hypothetical protein